MYKIKHKIVSFGLAIGLTLTSSISNTFPIFASQVSGPKNGTVEHLIILGDSQTGGNYSLVAEMYNAVKQEYQSDTYGRSDYGVNDADGVDSTGLPINRWFFDDANHNGIVDWYEGAIGHKDMSDYVSKKITAKYKEKFPSNAEYNSSENTSNRLRAIDKYEKLVNTAYASGDINSIKTMNVEWMPSESETLFSDFNATVYNADTDIVAKAIKEYNASAPDANHDGKPDTKVAVVIYYGMGKINDITSVRHDEDVDTGLQHEWKYHPAYFEHAYDIIGYDEDDDPIYGPCTHYHADYWDYIPIWQHQSNIVDHRNAPEQFNLDLSLATTAWSELNASVYWVGMLPGRGYDSPTYTQDGTYGYWQSKFNSMLQANLPDNVTFLDINSTVLEHKPYFTDASYTLGFQPSTSLTTTSTAGKSWKDKAPGLDRIWFIQDGESASSAVSNATNVGKENPYNRWDGDTDTDKDRGGKSGVAATDGAINHFAKSPVYGDSWAREALYPENDAFPIKISGTTNAPSGSVFKRQIVQSDHSFIISDKPHAADDGSQGALRSDPIEAFSKMTTDWSSNGLDSGINFGDNSEYADNNYGMEYTTASRDELLKANSNVAFWGYDIKTLQYIYHIILNSIYSKNEQAHSAKAIDTNLYSISASLTSYVNNVLGPNSKDNAHTAFDVGNVGNAGAYIGYGDSDFDFSAFLSTEAGKAATAVSFSALDNPSTTKSLIYARYGSLLADLGLDQYGVKTTMGNGRIISGGIMMLFFILSMFAERAMSFMITVLQFMNPFQFLQNIDGGKWQSDLTNTAHMPTPVISPIINWMSGTYNALTQTSWLVIVPLMIAFLITALLLGKRVSKLPKLKAFVIRVAFIAVGVPVLGILYTSTLESMRTVTDDTHSPTTQIIASTFVDFESWAKNMRLDPRGTLVYDNIKNESTAESSRNLRRTVLEINKASGVVNTSIGSVLGNNTLEWNKELLTGRSSLNMASVNDTFRLLSDYMADNFYYPSDWESDVMGVMSNNASINKGRRQGIIENGTTFNPDTEQGENTVYNMFSETAKADKWLGRDNTANADIFNGTKWAGFNIFSNGGNIGAINGTTTVYNSTGLNANGVDTVTQGGLSTLSIYNYLSSRFNGDGVITYSNKNTGTIQSRLSHHAINLIGSGVMHVLYYLNALALMLVIALIGVFYAIGTIVSVFKKGISVLVSIPGASLGVLKSITSMIVTVVTMIAEVVGVVFTYAVVTQLLSVFVGMFEGLTGIVGSESTILSFFANSFVINTNELMLIINFVISSLICLGFIWLLKTYVIGFNKLIVLYNNKLYACLIDTRVLERANSLNFIKFMLPVWVLRQYVYDVIISLNKPEKVYA